MHSEKKEFLWSYAEKLKHVKRLACQLEECRMAGVLPSKPNDGMPHGSGKGDLSGHIGRILELDGKLRAARVEAVQAQADILYATSLLEDEQEREVLQGRYIDLLQWGEVAERLDVSIRQVHNLHKRGIEKIKVAPCAHS